MELFAAAFVIFFYFFTTRCRELRPLNKLKQSAMSGLCLWCVLKTSAIPMYDQPVFF